MTPPSRFQHFAITVLLRRRLLQVISVLTIFALMLPAPLLAQSIEPVWPAVPNATLTVLNANDSGAGSLRQAVAAANPGDTIVFTPTLAGQIIALTSGEIAIDKAITIDGAAAPGVAVSGGDLSRVFNASIGPLTLNNLIMQHGYVAGDGGAVFVNGDVVLSQAAILSSTAEHSGGGLYVAGVATLTNTNLISNTALGPWNPWGSGEKSAGGGAYFSATVSLSGGRFEHNQAAGVGGGLFVQQALTLSGTQIISNTAALSGGGAHVLGAVSAVNGWFERNQSNGGGGGGALRSGELTLINTVFLSNTTSRDGGGALVAGSPGSSGNATITGGRFEDNRCTNVEWCNGGGLSVAGVLTSVGTDYFHNTAVGDGGGARAFDAYLTGGLFQDNASGYGGGIYVVLPQTLHMTGTHFVSNTAAFMGGGAYAIGDVFIQGGLFEDNAASFGGGLYTGWAGTLAISGTQFLANNASVGGGVLASGPADVRDGLFQNNHATDSGGGLTVGSAFVISNTRFIANYAPNEGSGIFNASANALRPPHAVTPGQTSRLVNSLLAGNTGDAGGGSIISLAGIFPVEILYTTIGHAVTDTATAIKVLYGAVAITDTIITSYTVGISNTGGVVVEDYNLLFGNGTAMQGTIASGGHDQTGAPDFMNPNADNYHLGASSSAISNATDIGIYTDLDYVVRPQFGGYDIGAYEFLPAPILTATNDSPTPIGSVTNLTATLAGYVSPAANFSWNFGDTTTGTGQNPAHTYGAIGIYTATVTAANGVITLTATTRVTITDQPILNLVAVNNSPTVLGSTTALTATATGSNIVYTWNFGDGTATANGATQNHVYPAVGFYTAIVTASNSISTVVATTRVTITDQAILNLVAINDSPTVLGNTTALTATATGSNIVYTWNFGDGAATANGAMQNHVYPAVGFYTAIVTASNSISTVVATTHVTITDPAIVNLVAINDSPTVLGGTTALTATATGSNIVYTWNFGDGAATANGATQNHVYPAVGFYTAIVTASNSISTVVATTPVTITALPIYYAYLPIILNNYFTAPELVVESVTASADVITVVIKNIGDAPAVDDFWVDAYIDPNPPPVAVNQIWWDQNRSTQGVAWAVTGALMPLVPGQTITLTSLDAYVSPPRTFFTGSLPIGTPIYAQVDSYNFYTDYGAVLERSEIMNELYNNILGPVLSQATFGLLKFDSPALATRGDGRLPLRSVRPE